MKLFVYREERVGWSERFHSLISSLIVSFTDMMRVVRQALLPAVAVLEVPFEGVVQGGDDTIRAA